MGRRRIRVAHLEPVPRIILFGLGASVLSVVAGIALMYEGASEEGKWLTIGGLVGAGVFGLGGIVRPFFISHPEPSETK